MVRSETKIIRSVLGSSVFYAARGSGYWTGYVIGYVYEQVVEFISSHSLLPSIMSQKS